MQALEAFKARYADTGVRDAWHRYAPSITVSRTFMGKRVFMDSRDHIDELTKSRADLERREWPVLEVPSLVEGDVWDVGANIGLFSVATRAIGRRVVAFEFSPKAAALLRRTSDANGLAIDVIERAFTVEPVSYGVPESASTRNSLDAAAAGTSTSITYLEAERAHGTPALLKMDIEGGEAEFFASSEFKAWLLERRVAWLVEVHSAELGFTPEWDDVPSCELADRQVLYCAEAAEVERIAAECAGR